MGNNSTITISLEALTDSANAKLTSFFNGFVAKAKAAFSAATPPPDMFFVQTSGKLKKMLDEIADGAKNVNTHVAGMSYYFRSAMDGIRFAMAGGGARAGFYAIDEAVRGLISSGGAARTVLKDIAFELVEMAPVLTVVGLGWSAFDSFLSRPLPMQEYLAKQNDRLKEQADWLRIVQQLQESGAISKQTANRDSDFNLGSTNDLMGRGLVTGSKEGAKLSETGQAFVAVASVLDEMNKSGLDETGKKLDEIEAKFQTLKNVMETAGKTLMASGKMTQEAYDALIKSIDTAHEKASNAAVADANFKNVQENQQKAQEAFAKGQQLFAEMVRKENEDLDRQLNLSAAQQGKAREQIWQEEYTKRMQLLERERIQGIINIDDYNNAVTDAQIKRLQGMHAEQEEQLRMRQEMQRAQQEDARESAQETLRNPFSSQGDKEKAVQSLIDQTTEMLNQNRTDLELAETEKERNDLIRERQQLEHEYSGYLVQQMEQEKAMNAARVQGVQQMFGNMAAAAKAFGKEGVAAYKGFAIAQATIDTAKAAIGAYSSVVGIPFIGPVLAPVAAAAAVAAGAAQIAQIESAAYEQGGFTGPGGKSEVAGIVHRGEFVIPADRVQQYGLGFFQSIHAGRFATASASQISGSDTQAGPGGVPIQHKTELNLATFGGEADAKRWAEGQDGEVWFLSMLDKHAYKYQRS